MTNPTAEKILIIGPSWLGDMVMAQSLFRVLKAQGASIDVLAPAWCFAVLKRMPEVDNALELDIAHGEFNLRKRFSLGRKLRKQGYTQAIVLPNSFKSALIPFFAGIPVRRGWLGEFRYFVLNDARSLNKKTYAKMVQRFVALAYAKNEHYNKEDYPCPLLKVDPVSVNNNLAEFKLDTSKQPVLALAPGAAFGTAKRWPEAYFAEVANHFIEQGWQVWLFGSPKDREVTNEIDTATENRCINLAGNLQLDQTVDLLSQAKIVISNDSGLVHVAAALDRSVVAIYGSTSPGFTPPLGQKVKVLEIDDLPCRPCFQRDCPLGHLKCLKDIKPEHVLTAIDALLGQKEEVACES